MRQTPFCMKQPFTTAHPPLLTVPVAFVVKYPFTASVAPGAVVPTPILPFKPSTEKIGRGLVVDDVVANLHAFTMFGIVVVEEEAKVISTPEKSN